MTNKSAALGIALLLLAASARVSAQETAVPSPVTDWSNEVVTVTARMPGPVLWRVSNGDTEVWLFGEVGRVPKDLAWDDVRVQRLMTHTRKVLFPAQAETGFFSGMWMLLTGFDDLKLPDGEKLESELPEPLRQRFVAARTAIHRDADRYADYLPAWAGIRLYNDFASAEGFTGDAPFRTLRRLADKQDVPVEPIAVYEGNKILKEIPRLSKQASLDCLKNALDDIDNMSRHQAAAAKAWAEGDLPAIEANYSEPTLSACLQQSKTFSSLWQRNVDDTVAAVTKALDRRENTIIVLSYGTLLRRQGVLDRLKASGLTIESPEQ